MKNILKNELLIKNFFEKNLLTHDVLMKNFLINEVLMKDFLTKDFFKFRISSLSNDAMNSSLKKNSKSSFLSKNF